LRTYYETQKDLDGEKKMAQIMEGKWACQMFKLPIKYHLDYAITRNDQIIAFCEMRSRKYSLEKLNEMGGFYISLEKWKSAKQLYDLTELPFIMALETPHALYYAMFKEFKPDGYTISGRKDRGDWQDIEPMVLLDTNRFTLLEGYL
jgi:hypothetical protein